MSTKAWDNEYRTTQVCVDEKADGKFCGRLYNPYREDGIAFSGVMEFLIRMDELLDQMQFPQPFTKMRSFSGAPGQSAVPPQAASVQPGAVATFYLRVLFRQNASWQGTIRWAENKQEVPFRSVLELLLMMDGAVPKEDLLHSQKGPEAGTNL